MANWSYFGLEKVWMRSREQQQKAVQCGRIMANWSYFGPGQLWRIGREQQQVNC